MSQAALPNEDSRPLTDRERRTLSRLLSDPTVYPTSFKTWLPSFLEISDMDLPMGNVHGLLEQLSQLGAPLMRMPSGTVLLFDGDDAPEGTAFIETPELLAAAPPGLRFIRVT